MICGYAVCTKNMNQIKKNDITKIVLCFDLLIVSENLVQIGLLVKEIQIFWRKYMLYFMRHLLIKKMMTNIKISTSAKQFYLYILYQITKCRLI